MRTLKILAHSCFFPPMNAPRCIQVPRLLENLDAQIVVLCGENEQRQWDQTIAPNLEQRFEKIIREPFVESKFLKWLDIFTDHFHLSWQHLPDPWQRWNLKLAQKLISGKIPLPFEPDLLLTFGQPMSDHLLGLTYKHKTNKPWIAHFSDPWVDNPFRRDNPLTAKLNQKMERQVIEAADAVIFTSLETIEVVMQKYPSDWRKKVFCVPHAYDKSFFDEMIEPPNKNNYVLRSIGKFYRQRSPTPLFEAVERIVLETPNLLDGVLIELVGPIGRGFNPASYPIAQRFIKCVGTVTYAESIRLMQQSHCLLVIDAPAETSIFFPSKLVDYIGAERFILAISPPGVTSRIVKELGGLVANPTDIEAIVQILKSVLKHRPTKLLSSKNAYSKEAVGAQMQRIINTVLQQTTEVL